MRPIAHLRLVDKETPFSDVLLTYRLVFRLALGGDSQGDSKAVGGWMSSQTASEEWPGLCLCLRK